MAEVLVFSDIHIAPHKRSIDRLHDCLKTLHWVFETAVARKIKYIVFAGDLFQDRQHIDVMTYHLTFQLMHDQIVKHDLKVWLLLGNHDLWYFDKWDISSVSPFSAIPGVTVVDKPSSIQVNGSEIDFLPYTQDPFDHLTQLRKSAAERKGKKILFGHLAVNGAKLNIVHGTRSDVIIEHDNEMIPVDVESFHGWDHVFLGHYHGAQNLSKAVEYIGSPLQLTFGEAFQTKHIIILDLKTGKKEYVLNEFSPQHLIIPEDEIENFDLKGNFVRITVKPGSSADHLDVKKMVEEQLPGTIEIIPEEEDSPEHLVTDAKSILQEEDKMLEIYVANCEIGNLEREYLMEWGKTICKKAMEQLC